MDWVCNFIIKLYVFNSKSLTKWRILCGKYGKYEMRTSDQEKQSKKFQSNGGLKLNRRRVHVENDDWPTYLRSIRNKYEYMRHIPNKPKGFGLYNSTR